MHRGDHHVELREQLVGQVEAAVDEDVDLHAGEDPEGSQLLVEHGDGRQLLDQTFGAEPVGHGQPW